MCLASFFFFFIAFLKLGSIILSVDWELLRLFWQVGVQNHKIGGGECLEFTFYMNRASNCQKK